MSEIDRLRQLLIAPEQAELKRQHAALADLQTAQANLPQRLPEMLEAVQHSDRREALHRALAPVVAAALSNAVRRDSRSIVDALFPIIGPAIRKAIAEALRGFVSDLNRTLDHSLTPRGLAWRLESWRSGVPFAQVVMKHSLRYRIDHLFLIERESGILLHRYSAPELPDLDADAIAGMLTAIGDFVRDSVQAESSAGGLVSATVGEHLLQVYEGPLAILACFVRGVPPLALAERLHGALENLHRAHDALGGAAPFDWDAEAAQTLAASDLNQLAQPTTLARPARWPLLLGGTLILGLALLWTWQHWQRAEQATRLRAALAATPGWQLLDLRFDGVWHLNALRDPDAASIDTVLQSAGLSGAQVRLQQKAYLALDDVLVQQRAQRALRVPTGVTLSVQQGELRLSGRAERGFVETVEARAVLLAGVQRVDRTGLSSWVDAADTALLASLQQRIAQRLIRFRRGKSDLDASASLAVQELAADLHQALALALRCEQLAQIRVFGWSDDGGSAQLNTELRLRRAEVLLAALVKHAVPADRMRIDTGGRDAEVPSASVHLQLDPRP